MSTGRIFRLAGEIPQLFAPGIVIKLKISLQTIKHLKM